MQPVKVRQQAANSRNARIFNDMWDDPAFVPDISVLRHTNISTHKLYVMRYAEYAYQILMHETIICREALPGEIHEDKITALEDCIKKYSAYIVLMWPSLSVNWESGEERNLSRAIALFHCLSLSLVAHYHATRGTQCSNECDTDFTFAQQCALCMHGTPIMKWTAPQCLRTWKLLATNMGALNIADNEIRRFRQMLLVRTAIVLCEEMKGSCLKQQETFTHKNKIRMASTIMEQEILLCWVQLESRSFAWVYNIHPILADGLLFRNTLMHRNIPGYTFDQLYDSVYKHIRDVICATSNPSLQRKVVGRIRANMIPAWFPPTLSYYGHITAQTNLAEINKHWHRPPALEAITADLEACSMAKLFDGSDFAPFFSDVSIDAAGYLCEQVLLQSDSSAIHWYDSCFMGDNAATAACIPCQDYAIVHGKPMYANMLQDEDREAVLCWSPEMQSEWDMPLSLRSDTPTVIRIQDSMFLFWNERFYEVLGSTWTMCVVRAFCMWMLCVIDNGCTLTEDMTTYDMQWLPATLLAFMDSSANRVRDLNIPGYGEV